MSSMIMLKLLQKEKKLIYRMSFVKNYQTLIIQTYLNFRITQKFLLKKIQVTRIANFFQCLIIAKAHQIKKFRICKHLKIKDI